ncbi:hypothetical protein EV681_3141 [Advenella incenata]|uniref:Uncharacterized protein n=1 Tax=Advenella incenata TaxID=267800 RepID=A0A4Q7VEP1_9BURK|nr:hypothetical protein EV681_3141 [Advenella incenata]
MHGHRASFRKRRAALAQRGVYNHKPTLDIWLTRMSNVSQPLLLCLAFFGYIYTVIPVYQKELLSEHIAAKEIELSRLQRAIDATSPTIQRLEDDRVILERQLSLLQSQKEVAERTIAQLTTRQSALEKKNMKLEASRTKLSKEVAVVEAAANAFSMRAYHDSFAGSVTLQYFIGLSDPYKIIESPTYEAISTYLLTPYDAVSSVLASGDSKYIESAASVPSQVKRKYHAQIRTALKSRRKSLSRPKDDVHALLTQIKDSLAAAATDPTPGDEFNELLYETKDRLVKILQDSRQREWDRTTRFLDDMKASFLK